MCFKIGMLNKTAGITIGTFPQMFEQMIDSTTIREIGREHHSGLGAPSRLSLETLIQGSVYHECGWNRTGTLGEHLRELSGRAVAESSLSERKQTLDGRVFVEVMDAALQPIADARQHPKAFYHGMRLLGVDGYEVSLPNTNAVSHGMKKAKSRRGKAAFAKMRTVVLSELGLHNPIAAAIGGEQESEMELARPLLQRVPPGSLSLGDRYYGVGVCISALMPLYQQRGSCFLFRARDDLNSRLLDLYADGSRRVEVNTPNGTIQVREILGKILTRSGQWVSVRLWTNLMDARKHPAKQLLKLYSVRWEQEIATDELKNKLGTGPLLKSQTPHTAVQEVAALIMAQGIVARIRSSVATHGVVPTLRVSFGKTLRHMQAIFLVAALGVGIFSQAQIKAFAAKARSNILHQLTKPRRKRSCQRAVRQPVSKWPRLIRKKYHHGDTFAVVSPI
ncbi:MAG: hypothetical protein A2Z16_11075 [Chloroflexi bacterium RBG_16_54_18]|nr:MAG: hypothetical protein A2Z16_11075 [Chloroflexi bacterium RBG_16_54_18]